MSPSGRTPGVLCLGPLFSSRFTGGRARGAPRGGACPARCKMPVPAALQSLCPGSPRPPRPAAVCVQLSCGDESQARRPAPPASPACTLAWTLPVRGHLCARRLPKADSSRRGRSALGTGHGPSQEADSQPWVPVMVSARKWTLLPGYRARAPRKGRSRNISRVLPGKALQGDRTGLWELTCVRNWEPGVKCSSY